MCCITLVLPQVSGSVDHVFDLGHEGQYRARVLQEAVAQATAAADSAGAQPDSCVVVEQVRFVLRVNKQQFAHLSSCQRFKTGGAESWPLACGCA